MCVCCRWGLPSPCSGWGLPPHVCTCRTQLYLQLHLAGSHCVAPHSASDRDNAARVCVVVMTKQRPVLASPRKEERDDELQIWEMVKVKENSQGASWRGAGGLYDVWVHLKFQLCVGKAVVWLLRGGGEGREVVIWCHSYGNVSTVRGLVGQEVRLQLSGFGVLTMLLLWLTRLLIRHKLCSLCKSLILKHMQWPLSSILI